MAEVTKHNGTLGYLKYGAATLGNRLTMNIDTTTKEIESSDADTLLVDTAMAGRSIIRISVNGNLDLTDTAQAAIFTQIVGLGTTTGTAQTSVAVVFGYSPAVGSTLWTTTGFVTKLSTQSPDETTATVSMDIRVLAMPTPTQVSAP